MLAFGNACNKIWMKRRTSWSEESNDFKRDCSADLGSCLPGQQCKGTESAAHAVNIGKSMKEHWRPMWAGWGQPS